MDVRGTMVEATAPTVPHVSIHINGKLAELTNFHFFFSFSPAVIIRFIKGDSSSRRRVWMLP